MARIKKCCGWPENAKSPAPSQDEQVEIEQNEAEIEVASEDNIKDVEATWTSLPMTTRLHSILPLNGHFSQPKLSYKLHYLGISKLRPQSSSAAGSLHWLPPACRPHPSSFLAGSS